MRKYLYILFVLLSIPLVSAQDAIGDLFGTLTGGFNFSGVMGTLNLLMIILIVGFIGFSFVYLLYQNLKYKLIAFVVGPNGEFLRIDRIGVLKDKAGLIYYRFRRTRERLSNLDFGKISRQGKKQFVIMVKAGEGAYYQSYVPNKFYTVDGKTALPVIDPNVMRSTITTLANQQRKYRLQDTVLQKYGTHIAILVVVVILIVGGYVLLRKEEQLIGLVGDLLSQVKGLQEALINKAVGG